MHERYPTRDGVPVNPAELDLPRSRRNLEKMSNFNNHHASFYRRAYGRSALLTAFRSLEVNQYGLPFDTHTIIHKHYAEPDLPTPEQAYALVMEQYDKLGLLRYGPFQEPTFKPITSEDIDKIDREYNQLRVA